MSPEEETSLGSPNSRKRTLSSPGASSQSSVKRAQSEDPREPSPGALTSTSTASSSAVFVSQPSVTSPLSTTTPASQSASTAEEQHLGRVAGLKLTGTSSTASSPRNMPDPPTSDAPEADSLAHGEPNTLLDGSQGTQGDDDRGANGYEPMRLPSTARDEDDIVVDQLSPVPTDSSSDSSADDIVDVPVPFSTFSVPEPQAQVALIDELVHPPLTVGDTWHVIPFSWWRRWRLACTNGEGVNKDEEVVTPDQIGSIDTAMKLDLTPFSTLARSGLVDDQDIKLVPAQVFALLKDWYGLNGPPLARSVIATGGFASERIELYPPTFVLFQLMPSESSQSVPVPTFPPPYVTLSAATTVGELKMKAREALKLASSRPLRLWRLPGAEDASPGQVQATGSDVAWVFPDKLREDGVEPVERPGSVSPASRLMEAMLDEQVIRLAVEQQDQGGTWLVDANSLPSGPSQAAPQASTSSDGGIFSSRSGFFNTLNPAPASSQQRSSSQPRSGGVSGMLGAMTRSKSRGPAPSRHGLVGLQNLGNTCFMNAALQCLSNTKELQEYFLTGVYKDELNPDNPLGMKGEIASAFGDLLEKLWKGSASSVAPREFKWTLARFAPQFSGYGQQDTQELLAFLLDGVHEDLNRIKKKPVTSAPDWEGGSDRDLVEMAKTCWEQYRSRNDSVVVNLFQGQYRSTVICPDCSKVSITFDPFMYVTVGLPVTKKWYGRVYFVPLDRSKPRSIISVELPKNSSVKALKGVVGRITGADSKHLVVVETFSSRFFKNWYDDDMVSEINTKNDHIVFFESPIDFQQPRPKMQESQWYPSDDDCIVVPVFHLLPPPPRSYSSGKGHFVNTPFFVYLTPEQASSAKAIYLAVAQQYARVSTIGGAIIDTAMQDVNPDDETQVWGNPQVAPENRSLPPPAMLALAVQLSTVQRRNRVWPENSEEFPRHSLNMIEDREDVPEGEPKPLLVRNGDILAAHWSDEGHDMFFGKDDQNQDRSRWEVYNMIEDPEIADARGQPRKPKHITIDDCLQEFTKEERLGEFDTWYCPACKDHKQASKAVELWKVPDVLVFALKRFSSSRWSRDKIDDFVDFPIEGFDLSPYVQGDKVEHALRTEENGGQEPERESLIYDLYAVDNHYGGLGGGHYTAYAKNIENGKWYNFDDSHVSEVTDPNSVKTKAAYLLFYRRRTSRPFGDEKSRELIETAKSQQASGAVTPSEMPVDEVLEDSEGTGENTLASSSMGQISSRFNVGPFTQRRVARGGYSSSTTSSDNGAEPGSPHSPGPYSQFASTSTSAFGELPSFTSGRTSPTATWGYGSSLQAPGAFPGRGGVDEDDNYDDYDTTMSAAPSELPTAAPDNISPQADGQVHEIHLPGDSGLPDTVDEPAQQSW